MKHLGLFTFLVGLAGALAAGPADADDDKKNKKNVRVPSKMARHGWVDIYDYQPRSGPPGTLVTITGRGFRPQTKVYLDGRKVNEESWDHATLRFYVPEGAGTATISLRQPPERELVVGTFEIVEQGGHISGFSPREGPPGTRVELWGRFGRGDEVLFNGKPLRVLDRSESRLVVEIPYGVREDVFVLRRPATGTQSPSRDRFRPTAGAPWLSGMLPLSGPPGSTVALIGGGFGPDDRVTYGDHEARVLRILHDRIEVEVPHGARLARPFVVRGPRGEAATPTAFKLIHAAAIRDFKPGGGPPGIRVTIRGNGFFPGDVVMLGGRQLPVERVGRDSLVVVIPEGARSDLFVLVRDGRTVAAAGRPFIVEAPRVPPIVGSFTPTGGPPGTRVTLTGAAFTPDVRVAYGNQALPILARQGQHALTVEVPRSALASAPFVVGNDAGETRSGAWFELHVAAIVESLSPTSGPPLTIFQVRGQGFRGDEVFYLGGARLRTVERRPDGYLVQVPAGAASGVLAFDSWGKRVRTPFRFDVLANPAVRWFGPTSGPAGTVVAIRGENLFGATQVYYGGLPCRVVRRDRDELVVEIPPAAQGADYLWVEVGGQRARSAMPFRVLVPQPVIAGFAPAGGPVNTQVTLEGGPFSPAAQVWFGNLQCPIASRGPNRLVVSIPPGANGRAPFTVTDAQGARAVSGQQFLVVLPPSGPEQDGHHEHAHEHPHGDGAHHHHPHAHPHRSGSTHHHPY